MDASKLPDRFGAYELIKPIGHGASCAVYLARQRTDAGVRDVVIQHLKVYGFDGRGPEQLAAARSLEGIVLRAVAVDPAARIAGQLPEARVVVRHKP